MNRTWRSLAAFPLLTAMVLSIAAVPGPSSALAWSGPTRASTRHDAGVVTHTVSQAGYSGLPLAFEPNRGQASPQVKFLTHGSDYSLSLTQRQAVFAFARTATHPSLTHKVPVNPLSTLHAGSMQRAVVRMTLEGASMSSRIEGVQRLPGKVNYLIGRKASDWHTNIPTYAMVRYRNVYPGIDLDYRSTGGHLEYDFVAAPHANPNAIRLHFAGVRNMHTDSQGNVVLATSAGRVIEKRPSIYQLDGGARRAISGRYVVARDGMVRFQIAMRDPSKELIIDPPVVFTDSTNFPGATTRVALDGFGNIYVLGGVSSPICFHACTYVVKLSPSDTPLYTSYMASGSDTLPGGISVDGLGQAVVAGQAGPGLTGIAGGVGVPIVNAVVPTFQGGYSDAYAAKLLPNGDGFVYATYLGGSDWDAASAVVVGPDGSAYITGHTGSADFQPMSSSTYQPTYMGFMSINGGIPEAFVVKLDPNGATAYATYLGQKNSTLPSAIALDSAGRVVLTGLTDLGTTQDIMSFPVTVSPDGAHPNGGAFVTMLDKDGQSLIYSAILGSCAVGISEGWGVALDLNGDAYIAGEADNRDQCGTMGVSGFVTELSPNGSNIIHSRIFDGPSLDRMTDITVDRFGSVYATGGTTSTSFLNMTPPGGSNGSNFVMKLDPSMSSVDYLEWLPVPVGGSTLGIAIDALGDAYVADGDLVKLGPWSSGSTGCTAVPSGLISCWAGEGNAQDAVGPNNGSAVGSVGYVSGAAGQAFNFDGSDYIDIPRSASMEPSVQITVDGWIKPVFAGRPTQSNDADVIFEKYDGAGGYGLCDAMDPNGSYAQAPPGGVPRGTPCFWLQTSNGLNQIFGSSPIPNDGAYHHVAGTYDGTTMSLYLDGARVASQPVSGTIVNSTTADAYIGHEIAFGSRGSQASVDEVGLYDRALTAQEVAGIYTAGKYSGSSQTYQIFQICTSVALLCDPPFTAQVQASSQLTVDYAVGAHCASIRVHILLDGQEVAVSQWLGYPGAPGATGLLPLDTGPITVSVPTSGTHILGVQGELDPNSPGCNPGWLAQWAGTLTVSSDVTPDGSAPTTSIAPSGTPGVAPWYTSPVSVTLSATDPDGASDVAHTYFTLDGGAAQTYTAPFTLSTDGVHQLTYWSVDQAGNTESAHIANVSIDLTQPTVTCTTPAPIFVYGQSGATVSAMVGDATSGPAQTSISTAASTSTVGSFSVSLSSSDKAGNSATQSCSYTVSRAGTATSVTSSVNPSLTGQVTFTAAVAVQSPGAGTPSGSLDFYDGSIKLGSRTLATNSSTGLSQATFQTSAVAVGSHAITASYGGDGNFQGSASSSLTQYVDTNLSGYPKLSNGAYNLANANLPGATLVNAPLANSSLSNTTLTGANLSGATLSGANLTQAMLNKANLSGANLSNANLSQANLSGANMAKANLSNANLSNATLQGVTGLSSATLTGVIWKNTTCPDGTNSSKNGGTCIGHL